LTVPVTVKPSRKRKAKNNFTVLVKTPDGTEEEDTLKGTTGWLLFMLLQDHNEP
jgi:hypothetical protein